MIKINEPALRATITTNLYPDQIVKNYKELCSLLNIQPASGNSKKLQLKFLDRYFSYDRVGQKYIIKTIYQTPLPKEDGRIGIFTQLIGDILLSTISYQRQVQQNICEVFPIASSILSPSEYYKDTYILPSFFLFRSLGMVNDLYNVSRKKEIRDQIPTSPYNINNFYTTVFSELNKLTLRALISLSSRNIIEYGNTYIIKYYSGSHNSTIEREATKEECNDISEIYNNALKEIRFKKSRKQNDIDENEDNGIATSSISSNSLKYFSLLSSRRKYNKFINDINNQLLTKYNYKITSKNIWIRPSTNFDCYSFDGDVDKKIIEEYIESKRNLLNNAVADRFINMADNKTLNSSIRMHNAYKNKTNDKPTFIYSLTYMASMHYMVDNFIRLHPTGEYGLIDLTRLTDLTSSTDTTDSILLREDN